MVLHVLVLNLWRFAVINVAFLNVYRALSERGRRYTDYEDNASWHLAVAAALLWLWPSIWGWS